MKWAKPRVVLRPGFAQSDVTLDHFDDVGVILGELGEVTHVWIYIDEDKTRQQSYLESSIKRAMWKRWIRRSILSGACLSFDCLMGNP